MYVMSTCNPLKFRESKVGVHRVPSQFVREFRSCSLQKAKVYCYHLSVKLRPCTLVEEGLILRASALAGIYG